MRICPHLNFNGNCRQAFERYQAILGGDITVMLTYGESPLAKECEPRWHHLILHAALVIEDTEIMGTDQLPGHFEAPRGVSLNVTLPSLERARAAFESLPKADK